ncbi:acyltransferase family protein [Microbacterium sp. 18062]|uniref:acyltransferase family protein n=1 Tax=Microbacterium sp. 18062 TaxID=2681410 RepID=UPI00135BF15A|nr:acyltransferase family protein [Microbacterium sp. 18062]
MLPHRTSALPRARYAGLDGLRAVAVALVVVYHLFPRWWLGSGFIGVDVFFVISGFLITSLLLREHAQKGRISLRGFWTRRARRLLPALALLLVVCSSAAWVIGGDVLVDLGRQLLGAAAFGYNWLSILGGTDYFSASGTELFRNLWSLAVEEQFYVLWPLLVPLLLLLPRTWMRGAAAGVLAVGSAAWMAAVVLAGSASPQTLGADITRAYFGTDTHAFGLLLGVALAVFWRALTARDREWMQRRTVRVAVAAVGAASLAGLIFISLLPQTHSIATFPGALLAASGLTVITIAAGAWPGSRLGRALDVAPLRWVGDRSYGIYLWHWPVLVLLVAAVQDTGIDQPFPAWVGAVALAVTLIAAEASYRLVETPVRRRGFRRTARAFRDALRGSARRRAVAWGAAAAAVALLAGTTAAVVTAPSVSSGQAVVEAGIAALEDQQPLPTPTETPGTGAVVSGDQITAVGDSVMLASAPGLLEHFPGIHVDAAVSRSMYAAPGILRDLAAAGQLRPFVVLALGTNGPISPRTLDDVLEVIGPDRQLILVNAYAPRSWTDGVNADLAAFARARPAVQVADWSDAIAPHLDLLAGDQIHPGAAGGRVFAEAVDEAVQRAERARARLAEFTERREYAEELRREQLFQPPGAPHAS